MEFKAVVCNLGSQYYGIDISLVQGIEREQEIVSVPNTASYIKGMINLRGEIIPIYSLRKKFGMEDSTGEGQFIIVRIGEMPLALEVDGVGEIYQADDSSVYETPKIVISKDTRYVEKVINANGRLIIMININMLLNDDEKSGIEGLIEAHK
ncbi:MAG: chemotaxis protein CheW [Lachnospiraceae bacterium]|nr:chemotaxis protein CheW [Lachnospiraceae bacterium]MDE6698668.1 chemotaxis protein CheW [Lachnospiraceae bacterium]